MYNKRRNYDRSEHRSEPRHERHEHVETKKYSKGLILLKSSVFAMAIVLATLAAAYVIIKNRKQDNSVLVRDCAKTKIVKISQEISQVAEVDGVIIVTTKADKNDRQELVRINASCGNELNRLVFQVE